MYRTIGLLSVLSTVLILSACSPETQAPASAAISTSVTPDGTLERSVSTEIGDGRAVVRIETDVSALGEDLRRIMRPLAAAVRTLPASVGAEGSNKIAAAHLREAAQAASTAGLAGEAAYLETVAEAAEGNAEADLDAAWPDGANSDLVAVAGRDGELFHLQYGLVDAGSKPWVEHYLGRLAEFEATLPLPTNLPADALGPKHATMIIAEEIERGGTLASSASLSTFIPAERERRAELGVTYIFWKTFLEQRWYAQQLVPSIPHVLTSAHQDAATARSHLFFYSTRYVTYQLGPQTAATTAGRVDLREHFGDLWGPLVIAKADLLFFLVHEWLIAEGVQPPEVSRENAAMLVLMGFRALADFLANEAPSPHKPASALQLNFLREQGAIAPDPESGLWSIDQDRLRVAVRDLVGELFEIHASGDRERARRLFTTYGELTPEIETTLRRVTEFEIPKMEAEFSVIGITSSL